MEGRAAPIKSTMPRFTWLSMVSGDVKRPTVTTGFEVTDFTKSM